MYQELATQAGLSAGAGVIISLALSYIPGLRTHWAALEPDYKRLIFLGAMVVYTLGLYGLSCTGLIDAIQCDQNGILAVSINLLSAVVASQSVYSLSPQTSDVRAVKEIRRLP